MKQTDFETDNQALWERFETLLEQKSAPASEAAMLPALYRQVCAHLALAKHRRYTPELLDRLNDLARQGYFVLYGSSNRFRNLWLRFIVIDFPLVIARNARFVLASALVFFLPLLLMGWACFQTDDAIYTLHEAAQVRGYEAMYDPAHDRVGRQRDSQDDFMMFGFYIYNNVGIAFTAFATGLLFGVGSLFILVYNGLAIGSIAGHLTQAGYGSTFFPFVAGHSALELLGIVLSGAAGLKLGLALLVPGRRSRIAALREDARDCATLIYGAGVMLIVAAAVEAFWSSRTALPGDLRIVIGLALWPLILAYLCSGWRLLRHAG